MFEQFKYVTLFIIIECFEFYLYFVKLSFVFEMCLTGLEIWSFHGPFLSYVDYFISQAVLSVLVLGTLSYMVGMIIL